MMRRRRRREFPRTQIWRDQRGLTTVEYVIVLCLVAVVGFAVWKQFGQQVEQQARQATGVVGTLPTASEE